MTTAKELGAAGARRAAALLGIAVCAEVATSSLDEDSAKVDLKISFRHVFKPGQLLTFNCQIKSGWSYRAGASTAETLALNIDKDTVNALRGISNPGLVIWVPPKPMNRMYWYASDPRKQTPQKVRIPRSNYVRPSLRYDLTRLSIASTWMPARSRQTVAMVRDDELLAKAKISYSEVKKARNFNPLVGDVLITRRAWRHVTRRSKTGTRRASALIATPYLKTFLSKKPDRYLCTNESTTKTGRKIIELRHVTCWYRGALDMNGTPKTLVIRFHEEVSYPADWDTHPLSLSDIKQQATLASWWCK